MTRPSQRREMAENAVARRGVSIALACRAFGVSETCYRYSPKLKDENEEIRAMRFRIAGVGLQPRQWPHLDPIRGKAQRHRRVIPRIRVDTPGFRTPGSRLDSKRGPAATRGVQNQGFEFAVFQAGLVGAGFRVASQKSGPVASDVPRFARQHTNIARKEPRYQRLGSSDPDWPPRWTPEASGAASACALLSRVY